VWSNLSKKAAEAKKKAEIPKLPFSLRIRFGEHEVEICGSREDVLATFEQLPKLIADVSKAFEPVSLKISTTKVSTGREKGILMQFPTIKGSKKCSEAVLELLKSDWGRWRPRTLSELLEAMKANALHYSSSTLSGVLNWMVRRGKVRRWKTDEGYVYILAEKESK